MLILFDAAGIAFLCALILTPLVRDFGRRLGLIDSPDGARKLHLQPVPRLGGVAILLAYFAALGFLIIAPYRRIEIDIARSLSTSLALLPALAIVFGTGLLDDIRGLRPWQKLLAQVVAAVIAHFAGFGIYVVKDFPLAIWISLPLTVIWLVGCANALNLIDGMDGLAPGVAIFAVTTTLVASLLDGNVPLALVTAPLAGSLLGFLRYNFNPASIFLGDCGSLAVGFLLGCYGAAWSHKSATVLGMTAPLLAMSIPLLEVAISVVRRFLSNRSIFEADAGHIHHRLIQQGLTPRRTVLLVYGCCGLAAAFALLEDVASEKFNGLILVIFCGAAWIGVQHLGYAEFGIARRFLLRGTLRGIISSQLQLQQLERSLANTRSAEELWGTLWKGCLDFGFSEARLMIQGKTWSKCEIQDGVPSWQLRIPLPDRQYVNVSRCPNSEVHPMVLATFAEILGRVITTRLTDGLPLEDPITLRSVANPPAPESRVDGRKADAVTVIT